MKQVVWQMTGHIDLPVLIGSEYWLSEKRLPVVYALYLNWYCVPGSRGPLQINCSAVQLEFVPIVWDISIPPCVHTNWIINIYISVND